MGTLARTPYHDAVSTGEGVRTEGARRANAWIVGGSLLLVVAATLGHYLTPTSSPHFHDALRRVYYIPIALVGVRCGLRAGLGIAAFVAVSYFPHIYLHWGGEPFGPVNLNRSFEVILWLLVGLLTGLLSDREREAARLAERERRGAEQSALTARKATRSLLEAQEQLRQADRLSTLGLLSAGLAHEVRNPLGSLKGIADMLRDDYPEEHAHRELVEILDKEVGRLDKVVEAFLENARQKGSGGPSPVSPEVAAVAGLLEWESRKREVRIDSRVDPPELCVPLPADLLRQILLNLVLNGLQVLDGRGGKVRVLGWREGERTLLAVEDDGPGFPEALSGGEPRAFFTTRPHGTGLGLAITREIVESHGGRMSMKNKEEGGARVLITFGALGP